MRAPQLYHIQAVAFLIFLYLPKTLVTAWLNLTTHILPSGSALIQWVICWTSQLTFFSLGVLSYNELSAEPHNSHSSLWECSHTMSYLLNLTTHILLSGSALIQWVLSPVVTWSRFQSAHSIMHSTREFMVTHAP